MSAARFWFDTWQRRGWFNLLLRPLSLLARGIWTLRVRLTTPVRLPVPVVVVGNLWPGGAGKTPVVIALVQAFQREGLQVGVISRGHGRRSSAPLLLRREDHALEVGDEPLLILRKTGVPVAVGRHRIAAAQMLLSAHPMTQILISDDGLQHLELAHDVALVVLDDRGLGNGLMLPAGPLREPWPRPSRARLREWVLCSGARADCNGLRIHRSLDGVAINGRGEQMPLSQLARGGPVAAVCGIAKPEAFFHGLRQLGFDVAITESWPDHAPFESWQPSQLAPERWICTEKDAVKLWVNHPELWAIGLTCELPEAFLSDLMQVLKTEIRSIHGQQTA